MLSQQEPRASQLHKSSVVIIGHDHLADEAHLLAMHSAHLTAKVLHVSADADVWASPERREQSLHEYTGWTEPAIVQIQRVLRIVERNPDVLCLALTAADIDEAHQEGKSALLLGFEGGKPIEQDLELLHIFYRLGLRVMQLTWAGGNDICDRRDPPVCEGLTQFGRDVVKEMNQLGILIDPGHCSRKTFFEALELSSRPVAVLHATPCGTKPGAGDLADDQIKALAETGGVIGLHFFSHYLNPRTKATLDDLVDHVAYIANLVGIDYVGLGGDYCELTEEFIAGHGIPLSGFLGIPEELSTYDKLINVTRALCARGYSEQEIQKILGGNLMRMFRSVFGG